MISNIAIIQCGSYLGAMQFKFNTMLAQVMQT